MSSKKVAIHSPIAQDKLEEIWNQAPSCTTDYILLFQRADNSEVIISDIMKDLGIQEDAVLDSSIQTAMATISGNIAHANAHANPIGCIHHSDHPNLRFYIKLVLVKILAWPARKYFYPQIEVNQDLVRAAAESQALISELFQRLDQLDRQNQANKTEMMKEINLLRKELENEKKKNTKNNQKKGE
ncbi:MAG TPA: hypothetical protein PKV44_02765 [Bacillota bacterium]|nr:hypothetical protein [Bacillota bacterium]HPE38388.1 hypothetical protein [Bacillota bacterium]